jgi:transcriptional/translational regulatory protein YebC/TACO1
MGKNANPELNPGLASALVKAKEAGLSKTSIDGAVAHATAKQDSGEVVIFEGRSSDGYMLIIEAMTENKNRTRPVLRKWLKDNR